MPVAEIAELPAAVLALLQEEVDEALKAARALADRLGSAIALRYAEREAEARRAPAKETGTIRIEDGEVTVVIDLPKKVDWNQDQLAEVVERIRAAGEDPAEYVDVAIKVPERKFTAWPPAIRSAFEAARTVRTGKPTFRLILGEEEAR
jgi:hypothetical protein